MYVCITPTIEFTKRRYKLEKSRRVLCASKLKALRIL